jgi:hypothetical protein
VFDAIAGMSGELFGVTAIVGFDCLRVLGSNIGTPLECSVARRDVLQMDCLSSEDLKEERNCSLTFKPTPNPLACKGTRRADRGARRAGKQGPRSTHFHNCIHTRNRNLCHFSEEARLHSRCEFDGC